VKGILDVPVPMEKYENNWLNNVLQSMQIASEMSDTERRFVNGLIRFHRPKNLLEIGVSQGGGSLIILNAIRDIEGAHLTSVDIMKHYYRDKSIPVGAVAGKIYDPSDSAGKWTLFAGKDPVDVMDSLKKNIDFCIIDTAHRHPIESLNFLAAFPYLADDAVVVLHDIALYMSSLPEHRQCFATKLLLESVVAEKLFPEERYVPEHLDCAIPNIGAFQLTPDTRKYIANVFSMLNFRWEIPPQSLFAYHDYFRRHYDKDCVTLYDRAVAVNWMCFFGEKTNIPLSLMPAATGYLRALWDDVASSPQTVFYGAGENCAALISLWDRLALKPPCEIWDIKAQTIRAVNAIPVVLPRFEDVPNNINGCAIIITIQDLTVSETAKRKLCESGYTKIYKFWDEILSALALQFPDFCS
jgi:predicted O-methyltransferase YrrM